MLVFESKRQVWNNAAGRYRYMRQPLANYYHNSTELIICNPFEWWCGSLVFCWHPSNRCQLSSLSGVVLCCPSEVSSGRQQLLDSSGLDISAARILMRNAEERLKRGFGWGKATTVSCMVVDAMSIQISFGRILVDSA